VTLLTIRPLDVLMLRGNRLFGGGVHGLSYMPPWPSVVTGAIVSRVLADKGLLCDVTREPDKALQVVQNCLGPDFSLRFLALQKDRILWFPLPADLAAVQSEQGTFALRRMKPSPIPKPVLCSGLLPYSVRMEPSDRRKPLTGMWISVEGLAAHFSGKLPDEKSLLPSQQFWGNDPRLGIALYTDARTAEEGAIYTTDAVALRPGVCLCADFTGDNLPQSGLIRLGGDGRAAEVLPTDENTLQSCRDIGRPESGWKGFRLILATPGLFQDGWRPPVVDDTNRMFLDGLEAELVAAAVPRAAVVSGWDIAAHSPKPARRLAPAGSCYWFRVIKGDTQALTPLWEKGLWSFIDPRLSFATRRHEGWNRVWFGIWNF
jgi:CRISPR-associated protein Cmr3